MAHGNDVIGSNFLEMWRVNSTGLAAAAAAAATSSSSAEDPDSPMLLNTHNCSDGFAIVGADKLSIRYPNRNLHDYDVGVAQANKPAPSDRMLFYFEIHVENCGERGQMSIGFTAQGFRMRRQPGWEPNSYGYHGDDGLLYRGHETGEAFGPGFTKGDYVGGGINFATQEIFFTKNGKLIGKVYKNVKGPLYPTVAVHSQNEELTVNFGTQDFCFKIKDYEAEQRKNQQLQIDEFDIPQETSHKIVRSYLQHYGYEETLRLFDKSIKDSSPPINISLEDGKDMFAISQRKKLRELISRGNIDNAIEKLNEWYPGILEQDDKSAIRFLLRCQKFIELIRENKPEEAMWYAKSELGNFYNQPQFDDLVKDCVALLAYEKPEECSVGYLLGDVQREIVADAVNAMILSKDTSRIGVVDDCCLHTSLEKSLKQLSACFALKRSLNGDEGETFNLSSFLSSGSSSSSN